MFSLSIADRVATITLSPPGKLNAIAQSQWYELARYVAEAAESDSRVVVLRSSEPDIFCSGADLAEFETLQDDPEARTSFRLAMRTGIEALADCPLPTIALVEAGCVGASVALILACDIRIAGPEAHFAVTPARLGLAYPVEDCARLVAAIGRGQAARMLFSAHRAYAEEALHIGLVESAGGEAALETMVEAIVANSPASIASLKTLLVAATRNERGAHFDALFEDAFGGDDFAKGLAAFQSRSKPEFGK